MQVVSVVRSQGFRTVVKHPSLEQLNTIVKKIVQRLVLWYVEVAVSKLDVKYMFEVFGIILENTKFGNKSNVVRSILDNNSVDSPPANRSSIRKIQLG